MGAWTSSRTSTRASRTWTRRSPRSFERSMLHSSSKTPRDRSVHPFFLLRPRVPPALLGAWASPCVFFAAERSARTAGSAAYEMLWAAAAHECLVVKAGLYPVAGTVEFVTRVRMKEAE